MSSASSQLVMSLSSSDHLGQRLQPVRWRHTDIPGGRRNFVAFACSARAICQQRHDRKAWQPEVGARASTYQPASVSDDQRVGRSRCWKSEHSPVVDELASWTRHASASAACFDVRTRTSIAERLNARLRSPAMYVDRLDLEVVDVYQQMWLWKSWHHRYHHWCHHHHQQQQLSKPGYRRQWQPSETVIGCHDDTDDARVT